MTVYKISIPQAVTPSVVVAFRQLAAKLRSVRGAHPEHAEMVEKLADELRDALVSDPAIVKTVRKL